jgi:N-acylneuraminate cytidylyltransferase
LTLHSSDRAKVLAVIPARGGSKSVPRKNLQPLFGKPLIVHSIAQALASRCITRVIVSTDDTEIADVARSYGAEVPFMRPPELAEDGTPDLPVFRHALTWLRDTASYVPVAVVHLRSTYPIRRVATIDAAIDLFLQRSDIDSLRSVAVAHQSPYKMWRIDAEGCLEPVVRLDDGRTGHAMPRQSLPMVYWQNGYVDVARPSVILDRASMGGDRILPFVIDEPGIEIDYAEDLREAERLFGDAALAPGSHSRHRVPS